AVAAEMPELRLDRLGHAANEGRKADADRNGLAVGREQPCREVERLVDDHVIGGAHEVRLHFLGHGDDAVAHDLGDNRIGLALALLKRRVHGDNSSSTRRLVSSSHMRATNLTMERSQSQGHSNGTLARYDRRKVYP